MKKVFFLLFLFCTLSIWGRPPVDISFMIVDYKYNSVEGAKICEVQKGILSAFDAYDEIYQDTALIPHLFSQIVVQYQDRLWTVRKDLCCKMFAKVFVDNGWTVFLQKDQYRSDPDFQIYGKMEVEDPYDISSYHGIFYPRSRTVNRNEQFHDEYPGIVLMDSAVTPYEIDKHRVSTLFESNPILQSYRPKAGLYEKKYTSTLASEILADLQSDIVVIKPRKSTLGRGILIVHKDDLDKTLKLIIKHKKKLRDKKDKSLQFWASDNSFDFLVEEFAVSDPVYVKHLKNQPYDPTFRSTYFLIYNKGKVEVIFLEHLIKLPEKSLNDKGSLNDKHKTCLKQPYYDAVPDELRQPIEENLRKGLSLMYEQMLDGK